MSDARIDQWHAVVDGRTELLEELLAEDAVFHSPVVHTPQVGKKLAMMYLTAAAQLLLNDSFRYVREIVGDADAALEFEVEIDGIHVNGIDLIHWDQEGRITDFKVMIRPLKAVLMLRERMVELMAAAQR